MNHQTKLKLEIAFHVLMVVFGLIIFATFIMLVAALFGHVDGDLAQRDWALGWAASLGSTIIGFFVGAILMMAALWVAKKRRRR